MHEDILRYYIYIGGTLLATFGSHTTITPRTPLTHRSTSPVPMTPPYNPAQSSLHYVQYTKKACGLWCVSSLFIGFCVGFSDFSCHFSWHFVLFSHLWTAFGTILEHLWKSTAVLVENVCKTWKSTCLHSFAPPAGANGTPRLSVTQRTICEHLQGISSLSYALRAQIYKTFSKVVSVSSKVPPLPKKILSKLFFAKDFSTFHSTFGNIIFSHSFV